MSAVRRDLLIVAFFVLLTRLPFITQPIQGDDLYYLYGAMHAQVEPLHPHHAKYVFQGIEVDMRGHPHPPLNAWILGGILALTGDIIEPVFHSVYLLFSMVCGMAVYFIAKKYATRPLLATLLFLATPVFWVNGTSLESDIPLLACAMTGIALFVHGRIWWAMIPLFLAGLAAYQSVALIPVLWFLRRGYLQACVPAAGVIGYQVFERITSGVFPVAVSVGYFQEYGMQRLAAKLSSGAALTGHLAWLAGPVAVWEWSWALLAGIPAAYFDWNPLFWLSFGIGVMILWRVDGFLGWWIRIFFVASLFLFFAGSARYLLPIAPAICIWASNKISEDRLSFAIAAQMMLAGLLAVTNYQHWDGYRRFVESMKPQIQAALDANQDVWVDGEWSLRFYAEALGAQPLKQNQEFRAGDLVLTQKLGGIASRVGTLQEVATKSIRPILPFRLIGLDTKSGWSSSAFGLRSFDIAFTPVDVVAAYQAIERLPTVSDLPMNAPEVETQVLSGIFELEENKNRWTGKRASMVLKPKPGVIEVTAYTPRPLELVIKVDNQEIHRQKLTEGLHTVETKPIKGEGESLLLTLETDTAFIASGDTRELGLILQRVRIK